MQSTEQKNNLEVLRELQELKNHVVTRDYDEYLLHKMGVNHLKVIMGNEGTLLSSQVTPGHSFSSLQASANSTLRNILMLFKKSFLSSFIPSIKNCYTYRNFSMFKI